MMKTSLRDNITLRQVIAVVLCLVGITLLGLFIYQGTRDIASGPLVVIHEPADGHLSSSQLITVTGIARQIAFITLNGRQIYTKEDGTFSESLLVPTGSSILEVVGRDKFNRTTSVRRHISFNQ